MKLHFICFFLLINAAYAADLNPAYQAGKETGNAHVSTPSNILKGLNLADLPGYQANIPQENYWQGITQKESTLKTDAEKIFPKEQAAQSVAESFNNRPYFHANPHSENMQKLQDITDNADAVLHGKSSEKTTCTYKPQQCTQQWTEKACIENRTDNTCKSLLQQGCEQKSSICMHSDKERCTQYNQIWLCPINHCSNNELICGEDSFCLDGSCENPVATPSDETDFKNGISALSASSEASKQFNTRNQRIFTGVRMECSKDFAGAKNCCRDSGWAVDLNLAHCKDSEKKLGKAKENNLVVATGEYCAKRKKFPGGSICVSRHNTYCVFSSKLARIVQEQGRHNQLGISFGYGDYTNCSGITPKQMQSIQFERIDFSEFHADIQRNMKPADMQKTTGNITRRMQDFYNQGKENG